MLLGRALLWFASPALLSKTSVDLSTCPIKLKDVTPRLLGTNHKTGSVLASHSAQLMCEHLTHGWWPSAGSEVRAPPARLDNCCGVGVSPHFSGALPKECKGPKPCRVVNFARNVSELIVSGYLYHKQLGRSSRDHVEIWALKPLNDAAFDHKEMDTRHALEPTVRVMSVTFHRQLTHELGLELLVH